VVRCYCHFSLSVHVCSGCKGEAGKIEGPSAYYFTSSDCTLGFSEAMHFLSPVLTGDKVVFNTIDFVES